MLVKSNYIKLIVLLAVSVLFMSWGGTGHKKINGNAELSFNSEMEPFLAWTSALVSHASDADIRKQWDPDEGPRHYIDIDEYAEFIVNGIIPQDIETAISTYGYSFVYGAGVLPWATLNTYDSLVRCFERFDWENGILYASDLGHYVADGHMPLHITTNYDGQYSGNYGIHSRYESSMINTYNGQIIYEGSEVSQIQDVRQYIFNYLYANYAYVDSVLEADDYAKSVNSNTSSTAYKQALWEKTQGFTVMLFRNASHALAELIYSAWCEAGKPILFSGPYIFTHTMSSPKFLEQNSPNPFFSSTRMAFSLPEPSQIKLSVKDMQGRTVDVLLDEKMDKGEHFIEWEAKGVEEGIYFLVLESGKMTEVRKMMHLSE